MLAALLDWRDAKGIAFVRTLSHSMACWSFPKRGSMFSLILALYSFSQLTYKQEKKKTYKKKQQIFLYTTYILLLITNEH